MRVVTPPYPQFLAESTALSTALSQLHQEALLLRAQLEQALLRPEDLIRTSSSLDLDLDQASQVPQRHGDAPLPDASASASAALDALAAAPIPTSTMASTDAQAPSATPSDLDPGPPASSSDLDPGAPASAPSDPETLALAVSSLMSTVRSEASSLMGRFSRALTQQSAVHEAHQSVMAASAYPIYELLAVCRWGASYGGGGTPWR